MSDGSGTSDPKTLLSQALALQHAGRWDEAERLYQRVLQLKPGHPGALQLLGSLALRMSQNERALDFLSEAVASAPTASGAHLLRANALNALRRHDEAVQSLTAAIAHSPADAKLFKARADTLYDLHRFSEALADYDRAIAANPNFAVALNNRGNTLRQLTRPEDAVASYTRAIAVDPADANSYGNCAVALITLGRYDEALRHADRAIELHPEGARFHNVRATICFHLHRLDDAIAANRRALTLDPSAAAYANNLGLALHESRRFDVALASFDQAVASDSNFAEAYVNRAETLLALSRLEDAEASLAQALKLAPDTAFLRGTLLHVRMRLCAWTDFDRNLADILEGVRRGRQTAAPFPLLAVCTDPALQRSAAEVWASARDVAREPLPDIPRRRPNEKIQIGYVSSDLRDHAVSYLLADVLAHHDRSRFHLTAFSLSPPAKGDMRRKLVSLFDDFSDVGTQSDRDIALLARARGIDIAVNLNGFTQGARTGIFSHRAAPLQVNYLGYPGTMGASYMDYIVADATMIGDDECDCYAEKVVTLPHSFQPNGRRPEIPDRILDRASVGLPDKGFVFCSFNNAFKITPSIFDLWMRILLRVPGSVLWLKSEHSTASQNLKHEAARRGVDPSRLIFAWRVPTLADHLARQRLADLFLDTSPYNAHTTAGDALWVGLPVLTRMGTTFVGRAAASQLRAIELPELIAASPEDYEDKAVALAQDAAQFAALKERLRRNLPRAPLFDNELYARHLERAYEAMIARYRQGLPADHIRIVAETRAA